jgi:hypothetical protein
MYLLITFNMIRNKLSTFKTKSPIHDGRWQLGKHARMKTMTKIIATTLLLSMLSAETSGADWPFNLTGKISDYTWHVVTGAAMRHGSGTTHPQGQAGNRIFSGMDFANDLSPDRSFCGIKQMGWPVLRLDWLPVAGDAKGSDFTPLRLRG